MYNLSFFNESIGRVLGLGLNGNIEVDCHFGWRYLFRRVIKITDRQEHGGGSEESSGPCGRVVVVPATAYPFFEVSEGGGSMSHD